MSNRTTRIQDAAEMRRLLVYLTHGHKPQLLESVLEFLDDAARHANTNGPAGSLGDSAVELLSAIRKGAGVVQ